VGYVGERAGKPHETFIARHETMGENRRLEVAAWGGTSEKGELGGRKGDPIKKSRRTRRRAFFICSKRRSELPKMVR